MSPGESPGPSSAMAPIQAQAQAHIHIQQPQAPPRAQTQTQTQTRTQTQTPPPTCPKKKAWVEPSALPNATIQQLAYPDASKVGGNAPRGAKQLALNTFASYGVGDAWAFGHAAGRQVRFVRIDADVREPSVNVNANATAPSRTAYYDARVGQGCSREGLGFVAGGGSGLGGTVSSATAVAELVVDKTMVNGNGMMHGGCIAYLIDNCGSIPLVVLGVLRGRNGVGVTQALNILFHAPAPLGSTLQISSTSLTLGGRSMTSKCEIVNKSTGRLVASAFLNKMEPKL